MRKKYRQFKENSIMWQRFLRGMSALRDRPFAASLGGLLVFGSLATIFRLNLTADAMAELVPGWVVQTFAIVYGLSGLTLLLSMIWHRLDMEAASCALIIAALLARAISLLIVFGLSVVTFSTVAFYIVFALGCLERARQCLRGEQIIRIRDTIHINGNGDGFTIRTNDADREQNEEKGP